MYVLATTVTLEEATVTLEEATVMLEEATVTLVAQYLIPNTPKRPCQECFLAYNVNQFYQNLALPHSDICIYNEEAR